VPANANPSFPPRRVSNHPKPSFTFGKRLFRKYRVIEHTPIDCENAALAHAALTVISQQSTGARSIDSLQQRRSSSVKETRTKKSNIGFARLSMSPRVSTGSFIDAV
jgi:hypothetical protein